MVHEGVDLNPLTNIAAIGAICLSFLAAFGATYAKGHADGSASATLKFTVQVANKTAEVGRKNVAIVKGDQELIAAKTQDKDKIVTIYRTILEQAEKQIVEMPVYRDVACNVPSVSMRLIAAAAAGAMPADPVGAASNPASVATSPGK